MVATLPAYLNALTGKGVHIVTVNDYLAKRDSEWMGKVYRFLGLSVGLIIHGVTAPRNAAPPTMPTSPTAPTTSSASITCATTWSSTKSEHGAARAIITPSWTRWTPSSSTKRARRSSSPARAINPPICTSMADQFAKTPEVPPSWPSWTTRRSSDEQSTATMLWTRRPAPPPLPPAGINKAEKVLQH